jgi:hypothetical protein
MARSGSKDSARYLDLVRVAVAERQYVKALDYSLAGLKCSDKEGAKGLRHTFLRMMRSIVSTLEDKIEPAAEGKQSQGSCSFCGRDSAEVQILIGAKGAICKDCTARARTHFLANG